LCLNEKPKTGILERLNRENVGKIVENSCNNAAKIDYIFIFPSKKINISLIHNFIPVSK